jgi:hypothetical protein
VCRTLRKDPQTFKGFVTLSIMEKLFRKHGMVLGDESLQQIRELYSVKNKDHQDVLKVGVTAELYVDLRRL